MGADLYIRKPTSDDPVEIYRDLFAVAIYERDRCPIDSPKAKEWQGEVERYYDLMYSDNPFYFRDSYNDSSVMWQLGLSWWGDIIPMLVEEEETQRRFLTPEDCLKVADMVEARSLSLEVPDYAAPNIKSPSDIPKRKLDYTDSEQRESIEYFQDKKKRLIQFLKLGAISGGIYCSL